MIFMKKAYFVNQVLSVLLILYAGFVFVAAHSPRLANLNDSFYFMNWFLIPLLTILLLIAWIVTFRKDARFFLWRSLSIAASVLWVLLGILFYCNVPLPYDVFWNNQPILSILLSLAWMIAAARAKRKIA